MQKYHLHILKIIIFDLVLYPHLKHHFLNLAAGDPVRGLLQLYAHQENAVRDLEQCRINPDFNSPFRNDLEFYIP